MFQVRFFFLICSLLFIAACGTVNSTDTNQQEAFDPSAEPGVQVGVLISPDEGINQTFLVTVEDGDTALDALEATGEDVASLDAGFGTAICGIGGVGLPVDPCFGAYDDPFWAFFHEDGDSKWTFAEVGADAYKVADGEIIAFVFTTSDESFEPERKPIDLILDDFVSP